MKYIVKLEKMMIFEADSEEQAKAMYDDCDMSLYEEEEIVSVEKLPADSIYNDYC